jgi:hypothetical protein
MLRRVALVRTDVSEELSASFIRVTRISERGTTLAVTSNRRTLRFLDLRVTLVLAVFRQSDYLGAKPFETASQLPAQSISCSEIPHEKCQSFIITKNIASMTGLAVFDDTFRHTGT